MLYSRIISFTQISIKAKEFNFLTNEGKIEVLNLVLCEIDGLLSIDEIIKRVPNAYHISISPSYISPTTSQNLAKLKQQQKIKVLELFTIDVLIDIGDFWDFLQENLDPKSKITLIYSFYIRSIEFFEVLKQMIQCWEPFDERPLLKC
uniref:Uncharacterized protein n=1 Tax=Panagrolaimus superbus TaxID=310955 RepID=A0A914Z0E2_9BILA